MVLASGRFNTGDYTLGRAGANSSAKKAALAAETLIARDAVFSRSAGHGPSRRVAPPAKLDWLLMANDR